MTLPASCDQEAILLGQVATGSQVALFTDDGHTVDDMNPALP